ncbi:SHOCT domain-containing protein [Roseateles sp.]|uniref:SHOCT domain-containing protein n=1 Tax=Roseateles sp. TaxID=1971397 RepID=UPI0031D0F1AC
MEFVVVWALLAIGVGWLATERGRSGVGFCLLSVVLSPLIGFVAVLVLPNLAKRDEEEREKREADRKSKLESERQHERQLEEIRALSTAVAKPASARSVADEIQKLLALKQAGALTEAEFEAQKSRLLQQ